MRIPRVLGPFVFCKALLSSTRALLEIANLIEVQLPYQTAWVALCVHSESCTLDLSTLPRSERWCLESVYSFPPIPKPCATNTALTLNQVPST